MPEGRIVRALSGFYDVKSEGVIYTCKGRGVFRKKKITPLVGDIVSFDKTSKQEGYIVEIKPRINELVRPAIANITQAILVSSIVDPDFSSFLLDRFLVLIESKRIRPIIVFTKADLATEDQLRDITFYEREYKKLDYHVEIISIKSKHTLEPLKQLLSDEITVVAGQSGVGKSSILNAMDPSLFIKTDTISKTLGRGKHTTRHIELVEINGGLVADTPGFSSLDFNELEAEVLTDYFPEFRIRKHKCKFRGCMHNKEPKCNIKESVDLGEISKFRYDHYLRFLKEIQARKSRYM